MSAGFRLCVCVWGDPLEARCDEEYEVHDSLVVYVDSHKGQQAHTQVQISLGV